MEMALMGTGPMEMDPTEMEVMAETPRPLPRLLLRPRPLPTGESPFYRIIPNEPHLTVFNSNPQGGVKDNTPTNTANNHLPSPSRWIFLFTIFIIGIAELL